MKTSSILTSSFCLLPFLSALAVTPHLEQGAVRNAGDHLVAIDYVLTRAPAIVTFDLQTNAVENAADGWVSIAYKHYDTITGPIDCLVDEVGVKQTVTWKPWYDFPVKVKKGCMRAVLTAWPTNNPPDYCVIDINRFSTAPKTVKDRVRYYRSAADVPYGVTNDLYKTTHLVMRRIPAAGETFRMGSSWFENQGYSNWGGRDPNEEATVVTLSKDYWMAIDVLTRRQGYYGFGHQGNQGDDSTPYRPMTGRRWTEFRCSKSDVAVTTIDSEYDWPQGGHKVHPDSWFGKMRDNTGVEFDFPTEAQWEFACRAGTTTMWSDGKKDILNQAATDYYTNQIEHICWHSRNSGGDANPVMLKDPNPWGLYDMHGNVKEWCLDKCSTNFHATTKGGTDFGHYYPRPLGMTTNDWPGPLVGRKDVSTVESYTRVQKGGSWNSGWYETRSACRKFTTDCGQGNGDQHAVRLVAPIGFVWKE